MPRLSIIIPHRRDDARLEATILSVLECRPSDSEIIVVHNGDYTDPYDLGDEVLFVECGRARSVTQLFNEGVTAACSPVICNLLDGVTVAEGWSDEAVELISEGHASAVSIGTVAAPNHQTTFGIASKSIKNAGELQRGRIELGQTSGNVAGPTLACGFFDRKTLRATEGWNETLDPAVADVELAWLLQSTDQVCLVAAETVVRVEAGAVRHLTNAAVKQLAELSVAFGNSSAGTAPAMSDLLRGCLSGNVSQAVSWSSGIMSARLTDSIAQRLSETRQRFADQSSPASIRIYADDHYTEQTVRRRAA